MTAGTGGETGGARRAIWVVAEASAGRLAAVSREVMGQALRLASESGGREVAAVLMGHECGGAAQELLACGADTVFLVEDPRLALYRNDACGAVLERLVRRERPDVVLFGATAAGEELAPTVAARLGTGLGAHCTDLRLGADGLLTMGVLGFGGRVHTEMFCPAARPQMASVKPGMFRAPDRTEPKGTIAREDAAALLSGADLRLRPVRAVVEEPDGMPLEEADVVVAGGWGVGGKDGWRLLTEVARALNGAVGCTRPALDEGWTAGEHTMIGTSGKTVRPKVYLGVGISGSPHHTVGIKDAGVVISINSDPGAPAFGSSDYGVVADFRKVLPVLLAEILRAKGTGDPGSAPAKG